MRLKRAVRLIRCGAASGFAIALACACNKDKKPEPSPSAVADLAVPSAPPKATAAASDSASAAASSQSGVVDIVVGTGKEAKDGMKVRVHYTGYLASGKKFESSYDKKKPYTFVIGQGAVIKGWDYGIVGMKVGGKRKLTIPPQLAYGAKGSLPTIPGNATLVFDIELVEVVPF